MSTHPSYQPSAVGRETNRTQPISSVSTESATDVFDSYLLLRSYVQEMPAIAVCNADTSDLNKVAAKVEHIFCGKLTILHALIDIRVQRNWKRSRNVHCVNVLFNVQNSTFTQ